jgi:hypothetical protein
MRKLILVTAIAIMSTTSCYANLSVASNDPNPTPVEQPKAEAPAAASKPETPTKATPIAAKPHRRPLPRIVAFPRYRLRSFSSGYGHCL